jgi:hypothetical protein
MLYGVLYVSEAAAAFVFTLWTLLFLEDGDRKSFQIIRKLIFCPEDGCMGVKLGLWYYRCRCQQHESHLRLHVKCPIFLSDFNHFGFSHQSFMDVTNTKFHKNPSSGSRSDTCGQTEVMKLKDAFCNHAKAPKNHRLITRLCLWYNKYHILLGCSCSLSYPSCKAPATYYIVICGLSGSTIFFHINS